MEECYYQKAAQQKQQAVERYNRHAYPLPPLKPGYPVRIQDPVTKPWDQTGIIISC